MSTWLTIVLLLWSLELGFSGETEPMGDIGSPIGNSISLSTHMSVEKERETEIYLKRELL